MGIECSGAGHDISGLYPRFSVLGRVPVCVKREGTNREDGCFNKGVLFVFLLFVKREIIDSATRLLL